MLASGHTAKSIANLTGRSEGAINERLRDARRKTGVSSSRELARIARDQENRHEEIGVAFPAAIDEASKHEAGNDDRRFPKGLMMMTILTAASVISLGIFAALPSQTASPPDTEIDSIVGPVNSSLPALRQRFTSEERDAAWAPRSEAVLAAAYRTIVGLEGEVQIHCKRTVCEIVGRSKIGSGSTLNQTMQMLQGKKLASDLAAADLHSIGQGFGGYEKSRFTFVAYWSSAASE